MALSWDKEMFDKNHDGKLTGSENTNWEIFWFGLGLGFGDKEDDEIYIAPKLIPDKKAAEIICIIDKAYDQFLTNPPSFKSLRRAVRRGRSQSPLILFSATFRAFSFFSSRSRMTQSTSV